MSVTELPGTVEAGQHRRRAPGVLAQRLGLGALLVGIAVATVAVPPLVFPKPDKSVGQPVPVPPAPTIPALPPTSVAPAATATSAAADPATSAAADPTADPTAGPQRCAPVAAGGTVEVGTRPSCGIYAGSLGNGWTVTGDGMKVLPGATVPDTDEPAMRIERSRPARPATTVTITAATAVGTGPDTRLTLRVWGGRDYGTVLRLSAAARGSGSATAGSVTLTAPADKWTSFTVKLAQLVPARGLARIDLVVAADQVPHVNRFFLDDIALAG